MLLYLILILWACLCNSNLEPPLYDYCYNISWSSRPILKTLSSKLHYCYNLSWSFGHILESLSSKLHCCCNLFWSSSLLGVLDVVFQQIQTFGCVFCSFEVLFQQVQAFGCVFHAFEVHVSLPNFFSMFMRCFYFISNSNDLRSCLMALMVTICIFNI